MKRVLLLLLCAVPLDAATFLVPADRDFAAGAKAIVVATAGASNAQRAPGGWIETVTEMHADEVINGPLRAGETFEVTELGGELDGLGYAVAGAPRYIAGEHILLFLETNDRGAWTAKNMALGKFSFAVDHQGRELLLRDAANVCGWNYDGSPHREPQRFAARFLDYLRRIARGDAPSVDYVVRDPDPGAAADSGARERSAGASRAEAAVSTPPASSYLLQDNSGVGLRWNSFPAPVVFKSHGAQPGAPNGGLTAALAGLAAWTNDPASNVVYQYGGTTTTSVGLSGSGDGVNSIQFNDPNGEIPGSFTGSNGDTLAIGGAWYGTATHTFDGEQFHTITEADLVVQDGIFGAGLTGNGFTHVVTHELGHTLGLRHSDQPPPGGTSSSNAIMNSFVDFNADPLGSTLQAWDLEALDAVYPVTAHCTPAQIAVQPQSLALVGDGVVLSVTATGDAPLQYQWFVGPSGTTTQVVDGGTTPQIVVRPAATTSYWVRVTNGCGPAADSNSAVVTVNGCPLVTIAALSESSTIYRGNATTLSVAASGGSSLAYQWFAGSSGDTTAPLAGGNSASLTVTPLADADYWVRVTNGCGAFADSDTIAVQVEICDAPAVVAGPVGGEFVPGDMVTLSAIVIGTAPISLQWFRDGAAIPNGTAATLNVGPLFATTAFTLSASNVCGDRATDAVQFTPVGACAPPVITAQPSDSVAVPGAATTLQVGVTGTSLTYRWYEGPRFDFTTPVGGNLPLLYTGPVTAKKQYWVRITNHCGTADSIAVTVTPAVSRRRATAH